MVRPPLPTRISEPCRRAFVAALANVRREFDYSFPHPSGKQSSPPDAAAGLC
jgi:hypothetical protein